MGSENVSFEAAVIAAVGVVLGVAHLFGAMLALLSQGVNSVLLLANSVPVTTTTAIALMLTAGFLGTGSRQGRYVGMVAFGAVAVFGRPSLVAPEPFPVAHAGLALLVVLYLALRNPITEPERSNVDESTSATRLGSTIR
ncbi:hypothetical protein SAMN05216559_3242 [Halomicrobium zhouii]|uniref:Uncharacterized protein n=1 Tax=Halomicrobium zhouii TaxID=767519 RepID=A0A1I6LVV8_9EURY|nr:hypothetical protein [Halomicrobium zhouii]SFS07548.1 hypothetical protein SAMN05216559_3242 [Halomicrobium zhouii]